MIVWRLVCLGVCFVLSPQTNKPTTTNKQTNKQTNKHQQLQVADGKFGEQTELVVNAFNRVYVVVVVVVVVDNGGCG